MDVDNIPALLPSPTFSSPKMDQFMKQMIQFSELGDWSRHLKDAGRDKTKQLLVSVLASCSTIVSTTALKNDVIDLSNFRDSTVLVESLNDDEVDELKSMVQSGDWEGLIKHRMCLAHFRRPYILMRY